MNAEDLDFILLEKFPHLLTEEEKEDMHRVPNSSVIPDLPPGLNRWCNKFRGKPEECQKSEFESRLPALGLTLGLLDELQTHLQHPQLKPVQKRFIFRLLRSKMLISLISCSDCSTIEDLISILRSEIISGIPAPVPEWYTFSTVTLGPRKVGYYSCTRRNCFKTETLDTRFQKCSQCSLAVYCSRECQLQDWKDKHKKVCKQGKENHDQTAKVGQLLQMFSAMSDRK